MTKERFKLRSAVFLLLFDDKGRVLMHLRQNSGYYDNWYSLVSGHLDGKEPATEAMIREAKEEAGIDVSPDDLSFSQFVHRTSKDFPDYEYADIYFVCNRWEGEITNAEPDKCKELKFFDVNDLPENTVHCVRRAIECHAKGIKYDEFGWTFPTSEMRP